MLQPQWEKMSNSVWPDDWEIYVWQIFRKVAKTVPEPKKCQNICAKPQF